MTDHMTPSATVPSPAAVSQPRSVKVASSIRAVVVVVVVAIVRQHTMSNPNGLDRKDRIPSPSSSRGNVVDHDAPHGNDPSFRSAQCKPQRL